MHIIPQVPHISHIDTSGKLCQQWYWSLLKKGGDKNSGYKSFIRVGGGGWCSQLGTSGTFEFECG